MHVECPLAALARSVPPLLGWMQLSGSTPAGVAASSHSLGTVAGWLALPRRTEQAGLPRCSCGATMSEVW